MLLENIPDKLIELTNKYKMTDLNNLNFIIFAIVTYIGCIGWVLYHFKNTISSLQKKVNLSQNEVFLLKLDILNLKLKEHISNVSKLKKDVSENTSDVANSDDENSSLASSKASITYSDLGPYPSMVIELPPDTSPNNISGTSSIHDRLDKIESDLELYLDKTFMLVGFVPNTGQPIYNTIHNSDGVVTVRDAVVDYWKSEKMQEFVGEQIININ